MKSFPKHPNFSADEQASIWAAKLDGSVMSATDRLALDEWLADHPENRQLLSRYCQFSADLEQQMPLLEGIREQSAEIRPIPATAQPLPWLRWPMMAGAALTVAAAVALVFWLVQPAHQSENIATPAAKRQTLTLADGTRVDLNAQTNLQIEINSNSRHVRLASGEAFFAVHKDPSRPFIVETPTGSVRVTGTKFDVRTDTNGALEVIVLEGSVQAHPTNAEGKHSAPVTLVAGDNLLANGNGIQNHPLAAAELDDALAWRQGQIVFKGTSLRTALTCFARYHGRGITAAPEIAELSIGGRYSLDDLEGFFDFLEGDFLLKVSRNLNGTIQVGRRPDL